MKKLEIITMLIMFYSNGLYAGCSEPPCYDDEEPSQPQNTIEEKKYGNWSPDVSRVVCLTGGLKTTYDDSIGLIEEGIFDELAKGYKWKEMDKLKLIKTSIEEIAGTSIYNLRYKSDPLHIKYRIVFGKKDHSKYPLMDEISIKSGYKNMYGYVHVAGGDKRNKYPTTCWGINLHDRMGKLDNIPK